ncbi:hypothetical protein LCGC14_1272080 [marine sediment metagenome]|uniref:Uncharacterized protein n=1 Tax=marine sediment metagenome TaxID=412755 RepID=A0A0F9NEE3_9ZZZZ
MKTKIDSIRLIFESILCHCAETTEFMGKSQILELIAKEASQGMKECDICFIEIENKMDYQEAAEERELVRVRKLVRSKTLEKENPNVKETDSPELPVP